MGVMAYAAGRHAARPSRILEPIWADAAEPDFAGQLPTFILSCRLCAGGERHLGDNLFSAAFGGEFPGAGHCVTWRH